MLAFLGTLFVAAYYDEYGWTLRQIWAFVLVVPVVAGVVTYLLATAIAPLVPFDPREILPEDLAEPAAALGTPGSTAPPALAVEPATAPVVTRSRPTDRLPAAAPRPEGAEAYVRAAAAVRGEQARASLVSALREAGELANAVEELEGDELLEALAYVDSLRLGLTESNQALQGAVRSDEVLDEG
jgi:hypothetical protein